MMVVFNNPVLYVAEYPNLDGVEVIDKQKSRVAFLRNGAAQRFRDALSDLVAHEPDEEAFDAFMADVTDTLTEPAVLH